MEPAVKLAKRFWVAVGDVGFARKMKLSAIVNYFISMSGRHTHDRGIGIHAIDQQHGIFWAITRMRVDVSRYPVLDEEIAIETWLQPPYKYEFYRDYLMKDAQGKITARAVSIWVVLDIRTRRLKPASLLKTDYPETDSERAIDCTLSKIRLPAELELAYRREIGCSDIDMHEHLNSSRYISLITDCFTIEQHRRYQVTSLQINYLGEVFPGDTIALYKRDDVSQSNKVFVKGVNEKDSSTAFTAELDISLT
ncbi:MAG: acyl-ACP thioesterase domain-containing protein [Thermacetogeniaceae bacterium]